MGAYDSGSPLVRERSRVRGHIWGAERSARACRVRLSALQAANRGLLLDELRRYRERGRFPLNHSVRGRRVPEFIDVHGTRCAMAHLIEVSGHGELVRFVAETANHARVRELARLPELRAWLAAAGLSLEESARIQPAYCFTQAQACFCGYNGVTELGLGTVVSTGERQVQVRVERYEGEVFPADAAALESAVKPSVGDEVSVAGSFRLGEQIFFVRTADGALFGRVGTDLSVQGSSVRCEFNRDTAQRPVTIDTVFEAMLANGASCVDRLARDNSRWNQLQCSESEADEGCGLALHDPPGIGAAGFTSAALFAALVRHRLRQRR
jgi:hypothetical protein